MNRLRKIFKNMKYRHKTDDLSCSYKPGTDDSTCLVQSQQAEYYGPQQRTGRYAVDHGTDQRKH